MNVHVGTAAPHRGEHIIERDRRIADRRAVGSRSHDTRPAGLAGAGRLRVTRSTQVQPYRPIYADCRKVNVTQDRILQIGRIDGIRDLAAADGKRGGASRGRGYCWNLVGPGQGGRKTGCVTRVPLSSPQDRTSGNRAARTTLDIVKPFIPPPFSSWSQGASIDTLGGQVQPVLYRDSLLEAA